MGAGMPEALILNPVHPVHPVQIRWILRAVPLGEDGNPKLRQD
jgi:hypothetical protein